MPLNLDLDKMLNPLAFLVRHYPYPPEIELFHNGVAFLFTLVIYVISFISGFHIVCASSYFTLCVYGYSMYKNLQAINAGWEKRRIDEVETEDDETEEVDAEDDDAAKEEVPSDSENSLEEGEIKEDRPLQPPPSLESSDLSDDSQDEDLPPLIPAHRINYIEEVD